LLWSATDHRGGEVGLEECSIVETPVGCDRVGNYSVMCVLSGTVHSSVIFFDFPGDGLAGV